MSRYPFGETFTNRPVTGAGRNVVNGSYCTGRYVSTSSVRKSSFVQAGYTAARIGGVYRAIGVAAGENLSRTKNAAAAMAFATTSTATATAIQMDARVNALRTRA